MSSSLTLGPYDLLDRTSPVILNPGWDPGRPEPATATIQSDYLDGERLTGQRSGNRKMSLPITVIGTSRLDLAAKVNTVVATVDALTWSLQWTPDAGLPVLFDCQRATVTPRRDLIIEAAFVAQLQVDCEALPFARTPTAASLTLTNTAAVQVESFDATTGITASAGAGTVSAATSTTRLEGSGSVQVSVTSSASGITLTRTGISKNLTGMTAVRLYTSLGFGPSLKLELQTGGSTWVSAGFTPTVVAWNAAGGTGTNPWGTYTWDISGLGLGTITGYRLTLVNGSGGTYTMGTGGSFLVDDLRAMPPSTGVLSNARGIVYAFPSIAGTGRTTAGLQLTFSGSTSQWVAHRVPADTPNVIPLIPLPTGAASVSATSTARLFGTYSVYVAASGLTSGATVTVTVSQTGTSATQTLTQTLTGAVTNGLLYMGEVTLPVLRYPSEVTATTTFAVASTTSTDRWLDLLLLDTRGQTIVNLGAAAATGFWVDEPTVSQSQGYVYAGAARSSAYLMPGGASSRISGDGPLTLDPGGNTFLFYAPAGLPTAAVLSYSPRWHQERTA